MVVTFAAAAVLMVTMGGRNTLGLFVSPINSSTGPRVTISFALAIAQFNWGAVQPAARSQTGMGRGRCSRGARRARIRHGARPS